MMCLLWRSHLRTIVPMLLREMPMLHLQSGSPPVFLRMLKELSGLVRSPGGRRTAVWIFTTDLYDFEPKSLPKTMLRKVYFENAARQLRVKV
jgi:hypothetical protein